MRYEIFVYKDMKFWLKNQQRHRKHGPAIEFLGGTLLAGTRQWWINKKQYTEEEFLQISPDYSNI